MSKNTYVLDFKQGDVNGDGIIDNVYLLGQKESQTDYYADNLMILVQNQHMNIAQIPLKNAGGYNSSLFLGPFTSKQKLDILVSVDTGGSGGYIFAFLYTLMNNRPIELFNANSFENYSMYEAQFRDNFKVEISGKNNNALFIIDVSSRRDLYINAGIYDKSGKLIKETKGGVLGLGALFPLVSNYNGLYQLLAYQRIIGIYNADNLGAVQTYLEWDGKKLTSNRVEVSIMQS